MAFGTLKFDTLTTSDSANTSTEKSLDTSYVFNGTAKSWVNFNGTSTVATRDSFNVSSVTDGSAGRMAVTLTSAYTSLDEYQAHGYGNAYNGDSWGAYNTTPCKVNWAFTNTTSLYDYTNHVSSGYVDGTYAYCFSLGDLA